jgi:NAD(P)H-dependent FMN reductase
MTKIVGISGSLRAGSFNSMRLRAAAGQLEKYVTGFAKLVAIAAARS